MSTMKITKNVLSIMSSTKRNIGGTQSFRFGYSNLNDLVFQLYSLIWLYDYLNLLYHRLDLVVSKSK